MNSNLISKAVRYALVAGAASAMAAPAVFAQTAAPGGATNANPNTAQLGKIEVTGTRIKRTDVETAQPVTIVTAAQIRATGLTSIGDVLQQLSSSGASLNTQFNNGGNGATRIDLRNLGSNRVLVLVNGRRWITGLGGPGEQGVDLNTIPVSIIDHIEILQDGASAIYGSDAIAGVINIITIKNYNGAEANAYYGMYDGHNDGGGWDGKTQAYDFTIGTSGDRSGVVMNVGYVHQDPITAGNRTISKEPIVNEGPGTHGGTATPWYAGSAGTPAGLVLVYGTPGGCPAPLTPSGSCALTLKSYPIAGKPPLSAYKTYTPADSFNFAPLNFLVTPQERTNLFVSGHYDLADNLTFTTEVLYNNRQSSQQLAPSPLYLGAAGSSQANHANIGISADNPYNPFGVDLIPNFGAASGTAWCNTYGTANCNTTGALLVLLGRRPLEAGNRVFSQNVATYQFNSGFNGYFNLLGSEWDWDVNYNYANTYESDITNGLFNTASMQNALSSSCATGGLKGCVPLDIFGGAGSITPAMVNYVTYEAHDVTSVTQRDYTGNITGDVGNWFGAGPVGTALGYEYLSYDGFFHPDALTSSGNSSGNVTQPTNGKESTKAEYIEFNFPLLSDVFLVKSLNLDLANRWSQFQWRGGIPGTTASTSVHSDHASTGRAALKWQPTDSLLLRASWSQGFRIPSISEFFAGNADSFASVKDPCAPGPNGQGGAPFCAANAGAGPYKQPNAQIRGTVGGNAGLRPESSISKSVGFVYNPTWAPGWDFSADYYNIKLEHSVSTIGFQNIMNGCYTQNNQVDCALITRSGAGISNQITGITNTNTNIGGTRTSGFDIDTHYKFPSTSIGDFKVGLNWNIVRNYIITVPTSTNASGVTDSNFLGIETGTGGVPRQRANINLAWNYGDWSATWAIEYIHSMVAPCNGGSSAPGYVLGSVPIGWCSQTQGTTQLNKKGQIQYVGAEQHIGATFYHDVSATYHLDSWNTDFTFGIRNLFDKVPPIVLNAFANSFDPTYYRAPGRFFYLRVGVKF